MMTSPVLEGVSRIVNVRRHISANSYEEPSIGSCPKMTENYKWLDSTVELF
jgi:hypothetical protein